MYRQIPAVAIDGATTGGPPFVTGLEAARRPRYGGDDGAAAAGSPDGGTSYGRPGRPATSVGARTDPPPPRAQSLGSSVVTPLFTVSRLTPKAAAMVPWVSPDSTRVTMDCRAHADSRVFWRAFTGALAVASRRLDNLSLLLLSPVNNVLSLYT